MSKNFHTNHIFFSSNAKFIKPFTNFTIQNHKL